jgi:hypothetical protein
LIDIWNVSNGKILSTIETKMSCIYDLEYKNNIISVVGVIGNEEIEEVYFKSYLLEIKVFNFELNHEFALYIFSFFLI